MTALLIYPYATVGEALSVAVEAQDDVFTVDDRTVRVSEGGNSSHGVLRFSCSVPQQAVVKLGDPSDMSLALRTSSIESRQRTLKLGEAGRAEAVFDLEFDLSDLRGTLDVEPLLLLNRSRAPVEGQAWARGSIIGWAPSIEVVIDERPPPSGRGLPIEWRSFGEDPRIPDGHLFHLQVDALPIILLNSDLPGAYDVLMSKGTHGARARIRDATFAQIVHQVWSSLLGRAFVVLAGLGSADASTSPDQLVDEVGGWEAAVLRDWSHHLFPAEPSDQALLRLVEEVIDGKGSALIDLLPSAIQARFGTTKGFLGLQRERGRFDFEAEAQ